MLGAMSDENEESFSEFLSTVRRAIIIGGFRTS